MHTKKPTKVITKKSKDLSIICNSMYNQFLRYKSFKRGVKILQQVQEIRMTIIQMMHEHANFS